MSSDELLQRVREEPDTYEIEMSNGVTIEATPTPKGMKIERGGESEILSYAEMLEWMNAVGIPVDNE